MKFIASARTPRNKPRHHPSRVALCMLSYVGLLTLAADASAQSISYDAGTLKLMPGQAVTVGGISTRITSTAEVLVQDSSGGILWRSNTNGTCPNNTCNLTFQGDGNLFINSGSGPIPLSQTQGHNSADLVFSATPPYIAVVNPGPSPLWSTGSTIPKTLSYLPGGLSLQAGQQVSIGGMSLQLTADGDAQVRDVATNALLWRTGTTAACGTPSACTLSFDATGNLTLTGPAGVVWNSGTATTVLGSLMLSKYAPHLSILENKTVQWGSGANATSMVYGVGTTLRPGGKIGIGGVDLTLTPAGNVQITNADGNTVWQSNSSANCTAVPSTCKLTFQGDGNLVLYGPNSNGIWSTTTAGSDNGYLTLSTSAPYLTIESRLFDKVWTSTAGKLTPTARTVSLPIRGHTAQAAPVRSFLDSMGVNTHQNQYELDEALVLQKLQYIGVRTIRDGVPSTSTLLGKYNTLAQNGIRFNLAGYNTNAAAVVAQAKLVANMAPGALDSLEGVNEINNFAFSFDGFTCRTGWPNNCGGAAAAAQQSLFDAVNADAVLNAVPVYDLTGGNSAMLGPHYGLMNHSGRADFANVHVYPGDNIAHASNVQPGNAMAQAMGIEYTGLYAPQGVVTEAGYTTAKVSPKAQAIMGINMWLNGYRLGYRRTFLYELTDGWGEKYGMYDASHNPKPLATATHNLTTILADKGVCPAPNGSLTWSAPGFSGKSILLQKSNGVFYLILWNEPKVADGLNDVQITATDVQVTVLNSKKVAIFDPFVQATPLSQIVHTTVQPSITSTVSIGANAVILKVTRKVIKRSGGLVC